MTTPHLEPQQFAQGSIRHDRQDSVPSRAAHRSRIQATRRHEGRWMIATERRKPVSWSPDEDAELKRIYAISNAGAAARALSRLAYAKSVSMQQCRRRAYVIGLARIDRHRRPWTQAEDENLVTYAGRLPVYRIAKIVGRTRDSVRLRIHYLQLSHRVRERGYTKTELADLLGLDVQRTFNEMLSRFPLERNAFGNFDAAEVSLWLWEHMDVIEFRKCDQSWLKKMLREAA